MEMTPVPEHQCDAFYVDMEGSFVHCVKYRGHKDAHTDHVTMMLLAERARIATLEAALRQAALDLGNCAALMQLNGCAGAIVEQVRAMDVQARAALSAPAGGK